MSNGNGHGDSGSAGAFWNRLGGAAPDDDEAESAPIGEAPDEVRPLVEECLAAVLATTGVALDHTEETLPLLDHYVTTLRARVRDDPTQLSTIAAPIGAYLGEVARRVRPMRWFCPPGELRRWRLELEQVLLTFNPIGAAVEALLLEDVAFWGGALRMHADDRAVADAALAVLPEVPIADYYSPSSRLEVLTIVADALFHDAQAKGESKHFVASDYAPMRTEVIAEELEDDEPELD